MRSKLAATTGAIIMIGLIITGVFILQNSQKQTTSEPDAKPQINQGDNSMAADLEITNIAEGTGEEAVAGKTISVHYTGTLTDGTKFDSSVDRGTPFEFTLGAGQVIQGWDQGFAGMKVGGKRKLVIPPSMGYGGQAVGTIPANSTLIFEVELLGVK